MNTELTLEEQINWIEYQITKLEQLKYEGINNPWLSNYKAIRKTLKSYRCNPNCWAYKAKKHLEEKENAGK